MAIGITLKKADSFGDPGKSKFFGDPAVPAVLAEEWDEDVIFFCQIRLSDIADLDTEHRLPDSGYLFILNMQTSVLHISITTD